MFLIKKGGNFPEFLDFCSVKAIAQTGCHDFRNPGQMATGHTKMACVIAFPVTYKVNVMRLTVSARQLHCLQGMLGGWHGRGRLPLHSLSEDSASRMCQTHLTVKVTCARALHIYTEGCSICRLITSTGHPLHTTFTLVFIWDFLSGNFRHLCRTGSSVRKRGKKHLKRCSSTSYERQS